MCIWIRGDGPNDLQTELDELRWAVAALLVIQIPGDARDQQDMRSVRERLAQLVGYVPLTRVAPLRAGADRQDLPRPAKG